MDEQKNKQLKYKNYTILGLLLLFMAIMFGVTMIKMSKTKIHPSNLSVTKENL